MSSSLRQGSFGLLSSEKNSTRGSLSINLRNSENGRATLPADEFDDDVVLNTPHAVRDSAESFYSNGLLSKSSSVFLRRSEAMDLPRTPVKEELLRSRQDSLLGSDVTEKESRVSRLDSAKAVELLPIDVLVDENNNLTTHPTVLSPPRKHVPRFDHGATSHLHNMEFDPSDHDLPEKPIEANKSIKGSLSFESMHANDLGRNDPKIHEKSPTVPASLHTYYSSNHATPRKLSPLKNAILPSSGSKSSASSMLEEIRRSDAMRPRTPEEIHAQINSSLRQLRQSDLTSESDDSMNSSVSDDESEDDDILGELDQFYPSETPVKQDTGNNHVPSVFEDSARKIKDSKSHPASTVTVDSLPQNEVVPRVKKNRTRRTGKLSGKYARKKLKGKQKIARRKFNDWLIEQWDKLQRLVDLSVPNSVISNSYIVMRELKCSDKQELALRVKFLEHQRHEEESN